MPYARTIQPSPGIPVTPLAQFQLISEAQPEGVLRIRTAGLDLPPCALIGSTGIRVIPDVHGAYLAFDRVVRDAERDNRFIIQLGNLIDYGYSALCVELMLNLEQRGRGQMLIGNHEYKFARFVRYGTEASDARAAILQQFEDYSPDLLDRFVARIAQGPLWIRTGSWFFVHAAFDPRMLDPAYEGQVEQLLDTALFGSGGRRKARRSAAIQEWVDWIPEGLTVVIGHVVTPSRQIEYLQGRAGGRAILLDTGAWRDPDGTLATLDIPFETKGRPAS